MARPFHLKPVSNPDFSFLYYLEDVVLGGAMCSKPDALLDTTDLALLGALQPVTKLVVIPELRSAAFRQM